MTAETILAFVGSKYETREQWLNAFVAATRSEFARVGAPLPDKVRVSVGFTSKGERSNRIGECWHDAASSDGYFEIFLKPTIQTDARMADILTHELCHAAAGIDAGHGPKFKRVAEALGLTGRMTSTVASAEWYRWALPVLKELGPMPYGTLNSGKSTAKPKQKTNLLKCECDTCGFVARVTSKWISAALDNGGTMQCPDRSCSGSFNHESGE